MLLKVSVYFQNLLFYTIKGMLKWIDINTNNNSFLNYNFFKL